MARLLPRMLTRFDLPEAELSAARLDGELFTLDECYWPTDTFETPHERAASLRAILPPRLIAERMTAAWIYGAIACPPTPLEVCADTAARYRSVGLSRCDIREVVLDQGDVVWLGGLAVTSPARTILDIARCAQVFGAAERAVVSRVAAAAGVEIEAVIAALRSRRHLPGKLATLGRLDEARGLEAGAFAALEPGAFAALEPGVQPALTR